MKDRLNAYIQGLFADAERRSPANRRLAELKEELIFNTSEKYDHLLAMGKTPEAAYRAAADGIGDITELLNDVIGDTSAPAETAADGAESAKELMAASGSETETDRNNQTNKGTEEDGDDDRDGRDDHDDGDEEDRDPDRPPRSRWYSLVSGIIWTAVLCAYFTLSFATHAWNVTWLLFIMGIAADNVAKCIFDLRR